MSKQKLFKSLINSNDILLLPCCHDGISAKILENAGFKAIAAAGFGTTGSLLGKPDIGLLNGMELVNQYKNIVDAVDIPVFVDIDTGYGDVNNVIRIVHECERIGAAGLFIEDQTWPKRCGHMNGKSVVSIDEFLPKLKAALYIRENPDFVIMARTDSFSVYGIDEAIRRAELFCKCGADMVFVEALTNPRDMEAVNRVLKHYDVPSFANMIEGGKTPILPAAQLQTLGYSVVAYPCSTVFTVVNALNKMAKHLIENGTTLGFEDNMIDFKEYYNFIGTSDIRIRENIFI